MSAQGKDVRYELCCDFFSDLQEGDIFAARITFSDEADFQPSGYINQHNFRIWGINNTHAVNENTRDGPKLRCLSFSV
jgi:hypothetical protein